MSDNGGERDGQQRNMSNGVEIFSGFAVFNPKPLLSGGFETGVVSLTFGTQSINRLKSVGIPVDGKPVIIGNGDVFSTAGALAFMKAFVVAWAVMNMT